MMTDSNCEYLKDKSFPYYNDQELLRGAGSISNDKIKSCKICAAYGFHHEPIVFRKITIIKWVAFDYFRPYQKHEHKTRAQRRQFITGGA